jgi:hypothetical protein
MRIKIILKKIHDEIVEIKVFNGIIGREVEVMLP